MAFIAKEKITGFQSITYDIDGQKADVMSIFYDAALDSNKGGKGTRSVERKCASREIVEVLDKITLPAVCEIELTESVTRSRTDLVVTSIRPVQMAKASV